MGIVSSTLISLTLQIVWNCQRLLDPHYGCVEKATCELSPPPKVTENTKDAVITGSGGSRSAGLPIGSGSENNNSLHQENRNRRARQLRYRNRPSSFDAALIVNGRTKNHPNVAVNAPRMLNSVSHPPHGQPARFWDVTSSSGCSSDSASDSDSESELRMEKPEDVVARRECGMSAAEEAAFRLTVGRGHFSRSKKDKFLNHLRLEKRLNDLNKEFFEVAYRAQRHTLPRCNPGSLHRF
ncbi:uncharacterized protein [Prorops nasuta]|uniref:uncharacterized protein n=1 Tax=Prorops nasuta TaxID=863751 RepID=UPI0034CF797D